MLSKLGIEYLLRENIVDKNKAKGWGRFCSTKQNRPHPFLSYLFKGFLRKPNMIAPTTEPITSATKYHKG